MTEETSMPLSTDREGKIYPTFKEAPNTQDQDGQEEVVGEVIQGGGHHTRGAWIYGGWVLCVVGRCEVVEGAAGGDGG